MTMKTTATNVLARISMRVLLGAAALAPALALSLPQAACGGPSAGGLAGGIKRGGVDPAAKRAAAAAVAAIQTLYGVGYRFVAEAGRRGGAPALMAPAE